MLIENTKGFWCKVVGNPVPGFDEGSLEWSFDVSLDEATVDGKPALDVLKAAGLGPRIKNKDDEKGNFLHLKRNAVKRDGEPAKPIQIVDSQNKPWDDRKIGNGSILNVSVMVQEYGDKKKPKVTVRPMALQVWSLVPYDGKKFPTRADEPTEEVSEDKGDW